MFVKSINMEIKSILSFHGFGTKLAGVDKGVGEVDALQMIQHVVLL